MPLFCHKIRIKLPKDNTFKVPKMDLKSIVQYTHDLSILYVEDDLESRKHITSILENLFSTVDIANDGQLGLDAYNKYYENNNKYYDLILSDIEMPNLNGIKLSETILNINPNQHIIIISAYNEREKLQKLLSLGIDNFLHKPIEFKNFFETFKKCAKPILEENKMKENLQRSQEINYNLEALLDIINQVALLSKTDLNGNMTYVNDIFCQTTKYTKEELLGQNHNIIRHQDMPPIVFQHMWEEITSGKVWKGKIKNKAKDGEPFYVNANIFPIYNAEGNIKEYIAIRFLTTQEEVKNREFKKKVLDQYQESKRRDFNSRRIIDELESKLKKYENFDLLEFSLKKEKKRSLKCNQQLLFTEDNYKQLEVDFEKYKHMAKDKIAEILEHNKKFIKKNESSIQRLSTMQKQISAREEEFKRILDENKQRAKEIENLRDVINHLESKQT